jgi:membrane-associated protease RseP (regulator of RpoE activity)
MDFIERIFGFSPDGGDGMFEWLLFAIPVMGLVVVAAWRRMRRSRRPLADQDIRPPSGPNQRGS